MAKHTYKCNENFQLELGEQLNNIELAYHTHGTLNREKSNVIWVFHALTANSDPFEWWSGLFGKEALFNDKDYFIVCVNALGSCYGSTGPINSAKEQSFLNFPKITVRDVVDANILVANHLGIDKVQFAIGGSFGGFQALEFSLKLETTNLIVVASSAQESPWNIAIHEAQRQAINADKGLKEKIQKKSSGSKGLEAARAIGLLTYRTAESFIDNQPRKVNQTDNFDASSYIKYQGKKLSDRFDAFSYLTLLDCLDTHDLSRNRQSIENALSQIKSKTLFIGIKEDLLANANNMGKESCFLRDGSFEMINSSYGHDGFLLETKKITQLINKHYQLKTTTMIKEIKPSELHNWKNNNENFQLIDVRETHEKEIADIGGELIPLSTFPGSLDKIKNQKVVIYCRSGKRSGQAVQYAQNNLKRQDIYNLKGGILAWSDEVDQTITKY